MRAGAGVGRYLPKEESGFKPTFYDRADWREYALPIQRANLKRIGFKRGDFCLSLGFQKDPPIHTLEEHVIRSTEQAADFVRGHSAGMATDALDLQRRLKDAGSGEEARKAVKAFRAWLKDRNLLPIPPDRE